MSMTFVGEKAEFFDLIKHYTYFSERGWFDLEAFCVSISLSLVCDEQTPLATEPMDIYQAFITVAKRRLDDEQYQSQIQNKRLALSSSGDVNAYLEHSVTSVHFAAMLECLNDWIVAIGEETGLLEESDSERYFGWIDESWQFTYTLVYGLHYSLVSLLKNSSDKSLLTFEGGANIFPSGSTLHH